MNSATAPESLVAAEKRLAANAKLALQHREIWSSSIRRGRDSDGEYEISRSQILEAITRTLSRFSADELRTASSSVESGMFDPVIDAYADGKPIANIVYEILSPPSDS